jgi:hypothetical protein
MPHVDLQAVLRCAIRLEPRCELSYDVPVLDITRRLRSRLSVGADHERSEHERIKA